MKSCVPPLRTIVILAALLSNACQAAEKLPHPSACTADVLADTIELQLADPSRWVIDTTHLGTRLVEIGYDEKEKTAILRPTWSKLDSQSADVGIRNIENSCLYLYQMVKRSDCTQAESFFEISVPQAYIDEGKMSFVFSLQGGKEDDYLFNGRNFTMKDFVDCKDGFKSVLVKASDYVEPEQKRRGIQRVGFTFYRNGSMVSAPIRVRKVAVELHSSRVVPPAPELAVPNPASSYKFTYHTPADVARIQAKVSKETMDITRTLTAAKDAVALIPQWKAGQVPEGHTGNVYVGEALGAPHNFETFEVQYLVNIPKAYFAEGKLDLYLCIQAGEAGYFRWSGVQRPLAAVASQAGEDMILTLTQDDFAGGQGKKRNQIEFVGIQFNRHGSVLTEPILLKQISVKLPK